jgi:hypothetical protein
MTARADHVRMSRGPLAVAALGVAVWLAVVAGAGAAGGDPIQFPTGWSHAEINVTQNGVSHTLIYDRGRVQSVSPGAVVLKERDGSVVSVPVSAATNVRVNGQPATLAQVKRRFQATTIRLDGGSATQLRAFSP